MDSETVTVRGFLVSSTDIPGTDISTKVIDTFLDEDIEHLTRCTVLSTDILKWRYATLSIEQEKKARSVTSKRQKGYSLFDMDRDVAEFIGAVFQPKKGK